MKQVIVLLCSFHFAIGSDILAFFPIRTQSHYIFVKPLLDELAKRGHNLTVYTPFPDKIPPKKYREIDISGCMPTVVAPSVDVIVRVRSILLEVKLFGGLIPNSSQVLQCRALDAILAANSTLRFDLLLTDLLHNEWYAGFAYKFRVPMINIFPNMIFPGFAHTVGAFSNPAFMPSHVVNGVSPKMSFWERLVNTYAYLVWMSVGHYYTIVPSNKVAKEIFGDGIPSLDEIVKNTSMTFVNSQPPFQISYPTFPNLIQVGGMNIVASKELPKNIEKFINESKHGVVYFCMGSLLRGETFPPEKREAFLYAFSKIPQRVLWKWEGDVLPGKSDNIMISKWMPQRDILAHPNVKLFISHGGLLGTSEAVYEGVPVLGIPIFGDQRTNIKSLEANGAGELLDYNEISKEVVLEKIQRLLNDPKYKENAKLLSDRYRDRPMSPLDTAVYWTEYVIRHKGAPHLRTAAADMPWYQYLLLDVIAFIVAVLVAGLLIIYYTTKFILRAIYGLICGGGAKKGSSKSDKKKRN
ncbi:UDP-glycosyltransferase UGT5-like isoform X41 [Planococcus citri]|uniref:UDP-glycosyltransferase UGT5-like isoform X41 n=1 Tax=Planococcus citri TaxID=170843 RepID=UPI0031F86CC3